MDEWWSRPDIGADATERLTRVLLKLEFSPSECYLDAWARIDGVPSTRNRTLLLADFRRLFLINKAKKKNRNGFVSWFVIVWLGMLWQLEDLNRNLNWYRVQSALFLQIRIWNAISWNETWFDIFTKGFTHGLVLPLPSLLPSFPPFLPSTSRSNPLGLRMGPIDRWRTEWKSSTIWKVTHSFQYDWG